MDQELKELYQKVILDHNKSPRNFRVIEKLSRSILSEREKRIQTKFDFSRNN